MNFLILEVLAPLQPDVVVHFHDVGLPREYPQVYATNPALRMLWTEAYLLQAFLEPNSDFQVLLAMTYLTEEHPDAMRAAFPALDPAAHKSHERQLLDART